MAPVPVSLSPNSQHVGNSKSASHSSTHVSSTINNNIPSVSCSNLSDIDSQSLSNLPAQKSVAAELHVTAQTSSVKTISPPAPHSPIKSDNNSHIEPNQNSKGSKVLALVVEASTHTTSEKLSTSSTPSTPQSADSSKSTYNFPSCRGRKNSLSAIVDKLKHNAVGSILDTPRDTSAFSESSFVSSKISVSSESAKPDSKTTSITVSTLKQDERETQSPLSGAIDKPALSSNGVDTDPNHLLENSLVCENSDDGHTTNSVSFSCANSLHSQTEVARKSDVLASDVSCEQIKNINDNLSSLADTEHGLHLTKLKDSSSSGKEECVLDIPESVPHFNKSRDKPASLKIPVPQQSFTSSPSQSPAASSCTTSPSPKASSLHSPSSVKNVSPAILTSVGRCNKSLKESNEQVFKMPSVKPAGDSRDGDGKPSEILHASSESLADKSENDGPNVIRENQERRPYVEKRLGGSEKEKSSSKLPSSPLSDISSPESGLIIDDEESHHLTSKASLDKISASSSVSNQQSPKSSREESSSSFVQPTREKSSSSPENFDCSAVAVSPATVWAPSSTYPAIAKDSPDASVAKESDSPCPIDDDLMDMALGFGS